MTLPREKSEKEGESSIRPTDSTALYERNNEDANKTFMAFGKKAFAPEAAMCNISRRGEEERIRSGIDARRGERAAIAIVAPRGWRLGYNTFLGELISFQGILLILTEFI